MGVQISSGDTAWILVCCSLVLLMTPACGFVTPLAAMVIGAVSVPLSYYAMRFRDRRKLNESLDVWACHGMGSAWGTIATGLFL